MEQPTTPTILITTSSEQCNDYSDIPHLVLENVKQESKDEVIDDHCNNSKDIQCVRNVLVSEGHICSGLSQNETASNKNLKCVKTEVTENEKLLKQQDIKQETVALEIIKIEDRNTSEEDNKEMDHFIKSEELVFKSEDEGKSPLNIEDDQKKLPHHNSQDTVLYKCGKCNYETKARHNMSKHQIRHKYVKENDMHKCSQCDFKSLGKGVLNQHVLSRHGSKKAKVFECPQCDFKSIYGNNLKSHIRNRHTSIENINIFKCKDCNFQTKYKYCLRNHSLWHKGPGKLNWYKCLKCDYETLFKGNMKIHVFSHKRAKKDKIYKCDQCEFKATYQRSLFTTHMELHNSKISGTMQET